MRVSDLDVDQYMRDQQQSAMSDPSKIELNLGHILVSVPENASPEVVEQRRQRAQQAADRVRAGEDFAKVARDLSDAPEAPTGGELGLRPADRYPDLFLRTVQQVPVGGIAGPVRSPAGFHVLRVIERSRAGIPATALQNHVRHILLRTGPQLTEAAAAERLAEYRRRILSGQADFATLAREHSQDGSAKQGGDLGWAGPGRYVPEFEEAVDAPQAGRDQPARRVALRRAPDPVAGAARGQAHAARAARHGARCRAREKARGSVHQLGPGSPCPRLRGIPRRAAMKHIPRKRFGQHFLADQAIIDAIVRAIAPAPGQPMVEIGPGLAALTQPLVERLGRLTVVELDRDLAQRLRSHGQLDVIESDVLKVDFSAVAANLGAPRIRIVGNLPYNISTPILFHLLEHVGVVEDQHFMLQKEVIDRMVAQPATSDYGRLSVMLQWRYAMEDVLFVPPESFDPPPRVDSAVVRMVPHAAPAPVAPRLLEELVQVAFSQRRKLLRHTLGRWLEARQFTGTFDTQRRAEEVPVADYVALAQACA